jgi:hypothetical protein
MTKTLEELITNRVSDCGIWRPSELVEFVITKRDGGFQLTMGYMVYAHCGSLWRPIITLKHLFPTEEKAEVVIEAIFAKGSVELEHWDSPKDPNQEELMF